MITVELLFYNDVLSLKRLIPTIIDEVYEVLALDGRHANFEKYNELSSDGSREYLQQFDNVKLIDCPNMYHVEKRKLAKELCKTDTLIILDSDEYIVGNWDEFRESYYKIRSSDINNIHSYALRIQHLADPSKFYTMPMVYYKPSDFTYYNDKHGIPIKKSMSNKPGIFAPVYLPEPICGIVVMHDHSLRSKQHNKVRDIQRYWQRLNHN